MAHDIPMSPAPHHRTKRNNRLGADYGDPNDNLDRPLDAAPDDDFAVTRMIDGHDTSPWALGNEAANAHYPFAEPGIDSMGNDDEDYPY